MPAASSSLVTHEAFRSSVLRDDRDITVYLPPGYDTHQDLRYPVLYLHDGQNLFDPALAFKKGEHWRVGETTTALIESRQIEPMIIVAMGVVVATIVLAVMLPMFDIATMSK